ncbi:hypothetical protein [Nocardioides limicola]|uniref:hypothetical protein n=1 Tax=Nocardioides limicola TaxID=2803368 RepID=UPI00193BA756|nr:hypothetical protein [Nocardioides sp. DJM-14]
MPVDPCDLLDPEDYAQWRTGDQKPVVVFNPTLRQAVCEAPPHWGVGVEVIFGYSVGPSDAFVRERSRWRGDAAEFVVWEGIGDEAWGFSDRLALRLAYHTAAGQAQAWARVGEQTVRLRVNRSGVGAEELRPLLEKLVGQVSPAMHEHSIVVPEACPSVDHPTIYRTLGEVTYARGDSAWACSYEFRNGASLLAQGMELSAEALTEEREIADEVLASGGVRELRAERGTARVRSTSDTAWREYVTVAATRQMLQVDLSHVESRSRPVGVSEADFDELMDLMIEAWRDAVG